MNLPEKLVQIGGLIQSVNDIGNNLPLRFKPAQIGDVMKGDEKGLDSGGLEMVRNLEVKPEPRVSLRTKPATSGNFLPRVRFCFHELLRDRIELGRVLELFKRIAEDFARAIAKNAEETIVCVGERPVGPHHSQQVTGRVQECFQSGRASQ